MSHETKEDVKNAVLLLKISFEFALPHLKNAISRRLHMFVASSSKKCCKFVQVAQEHVLLISLVQSR